MDVLPSLRIRALPHLTAGTVFNNAGPPSRPVKVVDFDAARFIRFRNDALQGLTHTADRLPRLAPAEPPDIFCELELQLEVTLSDALITG